METNVKKKIIVQVLSKKYLRTTIREEQGKTEKKINKKVLKKPEDYTIS